MDDRVRHKEQIVLGEIRRLVGDPLPKWCLYQITSIPLGQDERENETRCRAAMADLVRETPLIATGGFDLGADNWMVYLASELSADGKNHTNRGVLVEVIDPYDVMEWAFVVDARCISAAQLMPLLSGKAAGAKNLDLAPSKAAQTL